MASPMTTPPDPAKAKRGIETKLKKKIVARTTANPIKNSEGIQSYSAAYIMNGTGNRNITNGESTGKNKMANINITKRANKRAPSIICFECFIRHLFFKYYIIDIIC